MFSADCLMYSLSRGGYVAFFMGWLFLGIVRYRLLLVSLIVFLLSWQMVVPNAVRERVFMTYHEDSGLEHSGPTRVDLLRAPAVETFLGSAPIPAGKITQIRLVLVDATWFDGASVTPVACPSCTQTGLKIVTMGKLMAPIGVTLHVTLDFDREHSLHADPNGLRLDPVVHVARFDTR